MQKLTRQMKLNMNLTVIIVCTFFVALLYNVLSPYTADDYSYMFSSVTGERITNVFQIFPSLLDNYLKMNGRVLPHFFLQILLIGPKWIFNVVNSAMYVWLLWLMQRMNGNKKDVDLLLWITSAVGLWIFLPAYGQVFLWMSGSVNYSWTFVFSLVFISFYIRLLKKPHELLKKKSIIGLCIYGFFFGAYSPQLSFSTVFVSFLILCVVIYEEKEIKKYLIYVIPVVTAALGYLTMILSPAETERLPEMTPGVMLTRVLDIFETYYSGMRMLLGVWAVLLVLAFYFGVNKKEIIISIAFLLISMLSMAVLFAASYIVGRHYANADFFVLMANLVLMQSLIKKGKVGCVAHCICAYLLITSIWILWLGTYDIYNTYKQQQARDSYVYEQIEQGNIHTIYVTKILPETKYSCKYDLADLHADDTQVWPNYAIAAYYGIEEIYSIE